MNLDGDLDVAEAAHTLAGGNPARRAAHEMIDRYQSAVAAATAARAVAADDTQLYRAQLAFEAFMGCLGLDPRNDPHLSGTPARVARMFLRELFAPQDFQFTTFPADTENMVIVRDIPFASVCAHHFVPFSGIAHIGYIPKGRMVGLSKLARSIDHFARRPQVQETLTEQVAQFLQEQLEPEGLAVVLEAEHLCMSIRGVQKPGSKTITSALRGLLKDDGPARAEFMALVAKHG